MTVLFCHFREKKAYAPEKPFFMYWAPGASHGPHQVQKEWADKYKGKFDDGWDKYRERAFARQKQKGWIPQHAQLTPRAASMASWDSIPAGWGGTLRRAVRPENRRELICCCRCASVVVGFFACKKKDMDFVAGGNTTVVTTMNFDDAGAFSKALSKSNVVCMQTASGLLQFGLTIVTLPELELHLTSMPVGGCIALGDTAEDSVSFHVALSDEQSLNLGMPADSSSVAAYLPGGELAITARSGARLAYVVPSSGTLPDLYRVFFDDDDPPKSRQRHRVTSKDTDLHSLKLLLHEVAQFVDRSPVVLNHGATARNIAQTLLSQLFAVANTQLATKSAVNRAQRSHVQTVKRVHDYLRQCPTESVYVLDLCRVMGISQPTLFRAFRQILGIGPKEYLQIRRLHLSRQRLLHPDPTVSVHDVAYDLGFWHLGRFSRAYRTMFGEAPSQTLHRRSRNQRAT